VESDAKRGWFLFDNEDASPNKVNLIRPRYTNAEGQPSGYGEACYRC